MSRTAMIVDNSRAMRLVMGRSLKSLGFWWDATFDPAYGARLDISGPWVGTLALDGNFSHATGNDSPSPVFGPPEFARESV